MAFLNTDLIAKAALAQFENNTPFAMTGSRRYENEFLSGGYKYGDSVRLRKVNNFIAGDGQSITPTGVDQAVETLTINHQYNNGGVSITSKDLTLKLEDFTQEILRPSIMSIITKMETDIGTSAEQNLNFFAGSPSSYINSFSTVDTVGAQMMELGIPMYDSYFALSPRDGSALKSASLSQFVPSTNEDIAKESSLGRYSYWDFYQSQNIKTHTAGVGPVTYPSDTLTVNGAVSSGNTIVLAGATASITNYFRAGDVISIAGVYSVNPISLQSTGQNMQFVITAAANSSAGGAVTITVAPEIISDSTNVRMNVSNAVPNGAAVTAYASHKVNVAYTKRSLDIICPPMDKGAYPFSSVATDPKTGISLRVAMQSDILTDANIMRIDMLAGFLWHPQYAIRVMSKIN